MTDSYQLLEINREDHVAIVTLNRPEDFNALSSGLMTEIELASRRFLDDEASRVVVFRGAGKHFSAGADLKEKK